MRLARILTPLILIMLVHYYWMHCDCESQWPKPSPRSVWKATTVGVLRRVSCAVSSPRMGPGEKPKCCIAPFSWLHDPDMAWLIGVHSYEGVRYFNKELFEQLLVVDGIARARAIGPAAETGSEVLMRWRSRSRSE